MLLVLTLAAGFGLRALAAEPPVIPAEPAAGTKKKATSPAAKKSEKPVASKGDEVIPLPTPEPAVVSQKAVVIRGQARLNSEIVARLKQGDKVTVLEEIKTKKRADEPDRWYKIAYPSAAGAWVHASFLDADKKVKSNRLNVRTGAGENYSVIARLDKGTAVTVLETKGDWLRVEPPAAAYAFVAAHLVTREPAAAIAKATPPPPAPAPAPVFVPPPVAVAPPPAPAPVQPVVVVPPPAPAPAPAPPVTPPVTPVVPVVQPKPVLIPVPGDEQPLPKRIVTREGIVRGSVSVQAPTHFVLRSLDNKKTINYLFSTTSNITIREYRGMRVIVTGEEALDERWPNTPVIELETLKPLE